VATDWQMPRRSNTCHLCGHEFAIGETFAVSLLEAAQGYDRRDYCQACAPAEELDRLATWKTTRREPATPKRGQPFDREAVFALFRQVTTAQDPAQDQFRFVLALLLWRKKVLKFEDTVPADTGEVWRFRAPHTGDEFQVPHPPLDETEVEQLSRQVEQLLADPPADAAPAPANPCEDPHGT
jgi:hypothetical protein